MLKNVLLASALSVALLSSGVNAAEQAQAISPTIALVNIPLIMNDIPQAKDLEEKLTKEFGARGQEIQNMQSKGQALAEELKAGKYKGDELVKKQRELDQLQAEFNLKARAFQEDQQKRFQEEQRKLAIIVQSAIDSIAKERGIDLVLRGEGVAYTIDALDISNDVIERASKAKK